MTGVLALLTLLATSAPVPAPARGEDRPRPAGQPRGAGAPARADARRAARAVRAAREMVRPAGALPNPMVEVMLQDLDFPRWTVGEMEMSMVGPQVLAGIPFPGKRGARRRAAQAEVTVKESEFELVRREVASRHPPPLRSDLRGRQRAIGTLVRP